MQGKSYLLLIPQALTRKHSEALAQLEQEQKEELEALEEKLGASQEGEEEKKMQEINTANAQVGASDIRCLLDRVLGFVFTFGNVVDVDYDDL